MSSFPWNLGDEGEGNHSSNLSCTRLIGLGEKPIAQGQGLWASGGLNTSKVHTHQKFDFLMWRGRGLGCKKMEFRRNIWGPKVKHLQGG